MTQAQLAAAINGDRTAVWHWENGDFAPSLKLLPAIAKALNCTMDDLIGEVAA